jgi:hypothetical protein
MVAETWTGANYFLCGSIAEDATFEGKVNGRIQTTSASEAGVQRYTLSLLSGTRTIQRVVLL